VLSSSISPVLLSTGNLANSTIFLKDYFNGFAKIPKSIKGERK